jgi:hypothetical protein
MSVEVYDHIRTFPRIPDGDTPADSPGASGNKCDLMQKPFHTGSPQSQVARILFGDQKELHSLYREEM